MELNLDLDIGNLSLCTKIRNDGLSFSTRLDEGETIIDRNLGSYGSTAFFRSGVSWEYQNPESMNGPFWTVPTWSYDETVELSEGNDIQAAIDAITDASATKRYKILLGAGTWTLTSQLIHKQYVSLFSQGGGASIINGNLTSLMALTNQVELSGLTITNIKSTGVCINQTAAGTTLINDCVIGQSFVGIQIANAQAVAYITGCAIAAVGYGITLTNYYQSVFIRNTTIDMTDATYSTSNGVYASYASASGAVYADNVAVSGITAGSLTTLIGFNVTGPAYLYDCSVVLEMSGGSGAVYGVNARDSAYCTIEIYGGSFTATHSGTGTDTDLRADGAGSIKHTHVTYSDTAGTVTATAYPTSNAIISVAENTPRYDLGGGIRVTPERVNLVPYNAGENSINAAYWTASNVTVENGCGDGVALWDDMSAKLTATADNGTWTVETGVLTAGNCYMIGAAIALLDDDADPVTLMEFTVSQIAECAQGRTRSRLVTTYEEGGHKVYIWDMWDIVIADDNAVSQAGFKIFSSGTTAYDVGLTMYNVPLASSPRQIPAWTGPIIQVDDSQVTTGAETLQLLCALPTKLLPINNNLDWAIEIEIAWPGIDFAQDLSAYLALISLGTAWHDIFSWGKFGYGMLRANFASTGTSLSWITRNIIAFPPQSCDCVPIVSPGQSIWIGLSGRAGTYTKLYVSQTTREALWSSTPVKVGTTVQPTNANQITDGFIIGGENDGGADVSEAVYQPACVVRSLKTWNIRQAA